MEQIWWERVPNAISFTSDIIESLLNEKSVILQCSGALPWHSYMVNTIKDSVKQQNSLKRFEYISNIEEPGIYLLKTFCKPEKRASYRPSKSYAKFFAENDDIVLHERYLWVKVDSVKSLEEWTCFIYDYIKERGKNKNIAVFIVEWIGKGHALRKKGIKTYSFDNYISEYDFIVFCTLTSSSVRENAFIKNYLTELVINVVGNDIELCAACLENYKKFLLDPYGVICDIIHSKIRSDGSAFEFLQKQYEVEHLIWRAQIKTIYPAIEEYREEFVSQYASSIKAELPISSSYGEIYNEPNDVELGTLKYMADNGRLYLNAKDYEQLKIFKDARNKLSHLNILSFEEIKNLQK